MLRIKNTALDPAKTLQIRQATKLEMEPILENGLRLRLRSTLDVSEEWAHKNRKVLEKLYKDGVIEISDTEGRQRPPEPEQRGEPELDANGLKLGGPTLEVWVQHGYLPENYPPKEWAEVPSEGLTAFRAEQVEAQRKGYEELKAKEEAAKAAKEQEDALAAEMAAEQAALDASRKAETAPLPTFPEAPVSAPSAAPAAKSDSKNPGKKLK